MAGSRCDRRSAGGRHRYWPRSIRPCNLHTQQLINEITPDEPELAATNALQEGPGGQFDEMRTSHVEFIGTTISGAKWRHR